MKEKQEKVRGEGVGVMVVLGWGAAGQPHYKSCALYWVTNCTGIWMYRVGALRPTTLYGTS
jgi:hypothetical protein